MTEQSIKDQYSSLLNRYVAKPEEVLLAEAAELGRALVRADAPPEEIAELHETAVRRLAEESPDLPLLDTTRRISAPLMELLMGYGLAFREWKEVRARTERELTNAKLAAEAANRAKSEFLANMSHEIRTPLAVVLGFTDLLITRDRPRAEVLEHLRTIRRNADHLLNIINTILDLAKIEAEKFELELADCPPRQIVEEVASSLRVSANQKHLKLDVEFVDPLPTAIRTDAGRLRQILLNLVGNAIKFTHSGGVRITVSHHSGKNARGRLRFAVADTGIGLTAAEIGGLFQPFTQADMSDSRRFGGTGLGLAISQKLAGMLGGRIEVCSEPLAGSTFTLSIDARPTGDRLESGLDK